MNTEISPRVRSLVASVAAVAITTLLTITLVDSLNPARLKDGFSAPVSAAIADARSNAAFARSA